MYLSVHGVRVGLRVFVSPRGEGRIACICQSTGCGSDCVYLSVHRVRVGLRGWPCFYDLSAWAATHRLPVEALIPCQESGCEKLSKLHNVCVIINRRSFESFLCMAEDSTVATELCAVHSNILLYSFGVRVGVDVL